MLKRQRGTSNGKEYDVNRSLRNLLLIFTGISLLLICTSCASTGNLRTASATNAEVTGKYTLILYGGRYSSDIENVAILDKEEDPYVFEVYAPDFDYRVKRNVPGPEALEEAENFLKFHRSFQQAQLSAIIGPSGDVIGYEVRPLYYSLDFGYSDVLDIRYTATSGKISVSISLRDEVKRALSGDDRPFLFRWRR